MQRSAARTSEITPLLDICRTFAILLALGCDSGERQLRPKPTRARDAGTVDAITRDADLSYPTEWITAATTNNIRHACQQLIYKNGCREIRTGHVDLDVTLDERGRVVAVRTHMVRISLDPGIVEKCLLREVPKWRFHAPEHYTHELVLTVRFADMC